MKNLIGLAVFIGLIVLLVSTCPDKKDHTDALYESVTEIIGEQVPGVDMSLINSIPGMNGVFEFIGHNLVDVDDYFIFSLGKMDLGGDEQVVSLGICGHVFTFNDKIVQKGALIYEKGADALKDLF